MFESFASALSVSISPEGLLLIALGCAVGFLLGIMPGLSSTEGMIILLPLTYSLDLNDSMLLMVSAYASGFVGDSVISIVLGIPGGPSSLATIIDGYPLHRQGKTAYAISVASTSSAIGGIASLALVAVLMPLMEPISLLFGPVEWFAFVLFGLFVLSFAGETSMLRGLFSAGLGLLVGTIGLSVVSGVPRYTFGVTELWGGIPIVAAFVGLYPLTEALYMAASQAGTPGRDAARAIIDEKGHRKQLLQGIVDTFRMGHTLALSTALGWFIGVVPGVGATFANFLAYSVVKGVSRDKSRFGKGDIRGLIASDASNNATIGGALIPTLALGIPGSLNTAILLGVFLLNGVQPGANIFAENIEVTWVILIGTAAATIASSALVYFIGAPFLLTVSNVRQALLVPSIVFIACLAVLLARGNPFDLVIAFAVAALGILMKIFRLSRLSFVIALMLGPLVESSFFQSLSLGRGSYGVFVSSPVANAIWVLTVLCILIYVFTLRSKKSLLLVAPPNEEQA